MPAPSPPPPSPSPAARTPDHPAHPAHRAHGAHRAHRASWTLLASSTLFALMAAGTKLATRRFPGPEIALVRFVTGIAVTAVAALAGRVRLRPRRLGWLFTRGFFGGSAVVAYFMSIQAIPVGVATLLNQTQPIYTMLFSWGLLSERPRRIALAALSLTMAGVVVIVGVRHVQFHGSRGELLGIFSAVASGLAVTAIRAARRGYDDGHPPETAWTVFLSFTTLGALVTLPFVFAPFGTWIPPGPGGWALLLGVAATGVAAQLIMTDALGHVTGVQSGIISQATVPLTVLLGIGLLGEHLTASFVVGAVLALSGVGMTIWATAAAQRRDQRAPREPARL